MTYMIRIVNSVLKTSEDLALQGAGVGGQVRAPAPPDSLTGLHQ